MFKYAVINGLIFGNPAQYVEFSVPADEKRNALSPEQVKILLKIAKGNRAEILVHLALYCGLRRGEIMGLRWNDIQGGQLHISRSVQVVNNKPEIKDPKSKAGFRTVPIPIHLQEMLSEVQRISEYVVPSTKGNLLSKTAFNKLWNPVLKQLPFKMVLHQLRHTYATNLHKLGLDPKIMQYLMGHAQLDMTLGTYTDIQDEQLLQASQKIVNILSVSQKSVKTA